MCEASSIRWSKASRSKPQGSKNRQRATIIQDREEAYSKPGGHPGFSSYSDPGPNPFAVIIWALHNKMHNRFPPRIESIHNGQTVPTDSLLHHCPVRTLHGPMMRTPCQNTAASPAPLPIHFFIFQDAHTVASHT